MKLFFKVWTYIIGVSTAVIVGILGVVYVSILTIDTFPEFGPHVVAFLIITGFITFCAVEGSKDKVN